MPVHRSVIFSIAILPIVLAGCVFPFFQQPSSIVSVAQPGITSEDGQLQIPLGSGVYVCELGRSVLVRRDTQDPRVIELDWQGKQRTLRRYDSSSGLPRYEDRQNGLLWIDLPWKSVLMDARTGHPLANECKLS